jgi:hypothetical protein
MWLSENERKTLVFYYQQWAAGRIPLTSKEPWDEGIHLRLGNRGLITIDIVPYRLLITLTPEGIRLGQIYNSWWLRSNLWYAEHIKNHWIWLFICFLCGAIITQLINWLLVHLLKTPNVK